LGRLGYFIAEDLIAKGEKLVIVEMNENSSNAAHFRNMGADVYIGDARIPRVLEDVGVIKAKAIISAVNNDLVNLEVGLSARSFRPDMKLILRIFDDVMAQNIKEHLDIHLTLSMSGLADDTFFKTIETHYK
jgi:voltage-gated potassium channel